MILAQAQADDWAGLIQILLVLIITFLLLILQSRRPKPGRAPRIEPEPGPAVRVREPPAPKPRRPLKIEAVEPESGPVEPTILERIDPEGRLDPAQAAFILQEVFRRRRPLSG